MDESDRTISFDENGNCNNCNQFFQEIESISPKSHEKRNQMLEVMLSKIKKNRRSKYDCLIGMSGGVDSSYMAILAKEWGLNPLCVHMDNGWNSTNSVSNIRNICNKLDFDYQSFVLNWSEFSSIQLSVLRSSIVEVEIPTDIAIAGSLHKIASKNNIKFILGGGNYATEGILPDCWFYDPKDKRLLTSIHKKFSGKRIKDFPFFDFKSEIYYKFFKGIKILYPLNLVEYDKEKVLETLISQYDYLDYGGKHHESVFTKFCQSYLQPKKFNLDYRKATYSSLICSGYMKRSEALERLKVEPWYGIDVEDVKKYVAKKFNITLDDLENIINADPKSYMDYPNNEWFLKPLYNLYKKIRDFLN